MKRTPIETMTPRGGRMGLQDSVGFFQVDESQHVIELLPELKQFMVDLAEHSRALQGGAVSESERLGREREHYEHAMRLHSELENYSDVIHLSAQNVDHDISSLNITRDEVEHIEKMRVAVRHALNSDMGAAMTIARGLDDKLGLHGQAPAMALPEGVPPNPTQTTESKMADLIDVEKVWGGDLTQAEIEQFSNLKDGFKDLDEGARQALGMDWPDITNNLMRVGASDDAAGLQKLLDEMRNRPEEQQAAFAHFHGLMTSHNQAARNDDRSAHISNLAKTIGGAAGGQQAQQAAALAGNRGPTNDPAQNNAIHHTSALIEGVAGLITWPVSALMGKVNERSERLEADRIFSKTMSDSAAKIERFDGVQKLVDELKTLPAGAGNARAGEIVKELQAASTKFVNDSQTGKPAEARASADPTVKSSMKHSEDDIAKDFKDDGKKLGDMIKDAMKAPAVAADPKLKKELEESNEKLAEAMKRILEMIRKLFKAFGSKESPKQTAGPGGP